MQHKHKMRLLAALTAAMLLAGCAGSASASRPGSDCRKFSKRNLRKNQNSAPAGGGQFYYIPFFDRCKRIVQYKL